MIESKTFVDADQEATGRETIEVVVQKLILVTPANSGEALMAVAEGVIEAEDERCQLDLSGRVRREVIHRVPGLLAQRVRQRDEFENLPGDRTNTLSRNLV